jgi:hypothetical protein
MEESCEFLRALDQACGTVCELLIKNGGKVAIDILVTLMLSLLTVPFLLRKSERRSRGS